MRGFEWGASLLVVLGVSLMIWGANNGPGPFLWLYCLGVVLLTFGVRLAIDVARVKDEP